MGRVESEFVEQTDEVACEVGDRPGPGGHLRLAVPAGIDPQGPPTLRDVERLALEDAVISGEAVEEQDGSALPLVCMEKLCRCGHGPLIATPPGDLTLGPLCEGESVFAA